MKKMGTRDRDESRISSVCRWLSMSKNLSRRVIVACTVGAALFLAATLLAETGGAQQQTSPDQKQDQNIPDAPSAVQPPKPLPETAPPQQPALQILPAHTPTTSQPPPQKPS